jgi:hypothetical protein
MCHFVCVMTLVLILAVINPINTRVTTNAQSRIIYEDVPTVWFDITQFSITMWRCKSIFMYLLRREKSHVITVFTNYLIPYTSITKIQLSTRAPT